MPLPLKNRKWLEKWLQLKTSHHPKLIELEDAVWEFCWGIYVSPEAGRLLVIAGDNGTGKTHCAKQVQKWASQLNFQYMPNSNVIRTFGANVVYISWPELLDSFKNGGWDVIEDLNAASLLIIDELGGGHDPSGVGIDKLCQIISRRERKWTMITTNIMPHAWDEKFDRRVASRFMRNSLNVDLSDVPDYSTI